MTSPAAGTQQDSSYIIDEDVKPNVTPAYLNPASPAPQRTSSNTPLPSPFPATTVATSGHNGTLTMMDTLSTMNQPQVRPMFVQTELMSTVSNWVSHGPHLIASVFAERNHEISRLKQQLDDARVAASEVSDGYYAREQLQSENTHLKTQLERVLNEVNSLKAQKENHQTNTGTDASQSNEAAQVTPSTQSAPPYENGQSTQQGHSNGTTRSGSSVEKPHLGERLRETNQRIGHLNKDIRKYRRELDELREKLRENKRVEQTTIETLEDLSGHHTHQEAQKQQQNGNNNGNKKRRTSNHDNGGRGGREKLSVRQLVELIYTRISVLQKRVQDECKVACVEAQRKREALAQVTQLEMDVKNVQRRAESAARKADAYRSRIEQLEEEKHQKSQYVSHNSSSEVEVRKVQKRNESLQLQNDRYKANVVQLKEKTEKMQKKMQDQVAKVADSLASEKKKSTRLSADVTKFKELAADYENQLNQVRQVAATIGASLTVPTPTKSGSKKSTKKSKKKSKGSKSDSDDSDDADEDEESGDSSSESEVVNVADDVKSPRSSKSPKTKKDVKDKVSKKGTWNRTPKVTKTIDKKVKTSNQKARKERSSRKRPKK